MGKGRKIGLCATCVLAIGLLLSCTTTVSTDDNGINVGFTIAGVTVSIALGAESSFDIVADGPPVQKTVALRLFDETPVDKPTGATLILPAASVTFIPSESEGKVRRKTVEDVPELACLMEVYMAGTGTANPCEDGVYVGTFEILRAADGIVIRENEARIVDPLLDAARAGLFNLCLRVTGRMTGRLLVDELQIRYDETTVDDNTNANTNTNTNTNDNTSDDTNANDNTNDNANDNVADDANDNVSDNTNDNTDDVDPLDPDGDGKFDAQVCDDHTAVEIIAEDPPRYSGSEGNVACLAKIHFKNVSTDNIVIWWHVHKEVPATGNVTEDGWYSTSLGPGDEVDSVDSAWIYSEQNDTLLHVVTDEVMVSRYDNEYEAGCSWLSTAIREDDSVIDLVRIDVTDLNPCE